MVDRKKHGHWGDPDLVHVSLGHRSGLPHILSTFLLKTAVFLWFQSILDWLKIIPCPFAKDWFMNGHVNPDGGHWEVKRGLLRDSKKVLAHPFRATFLTWPSVTTNCKIRSHHLMTVKGVVFRERMKPWMLDRKNVSPCVTLGLLDRVALNSVSLLNLQFCEPVNILIVYSCLPHYCCSLPRKAA